MTEETAAPVEEQAGEVETVTPSDPDAVELTPEQQARFNKVYAALKKQEKFSEALAKDHKALIEKLKEDASERDKARADAQVDDLKRRKVKALSEADYEAVAQIDDEILAARAPKEPDPAVEPEKDEFAFTDTQQERLVSWASERGQDGTLLRPWADPSHPLHQRAMKQADAVLADPKFHGRPVDDVLDEVLKEVDAIMRPPKAVTPRAPVLNGNQNARPKEKKIELTQDQKLIAAKMGMSTEDYEKAVAKWQ